MLKVITSSKIYLISKCCAFKIYIEESRLFK